MPPSIIGHRGAAGLVAENTLPGFRAAQRWGVDGVELDVHWVHERLWVLHDERVDRTTDGRGLLQALSLDAIRALDAGAGPIPELPQVLAALPDPLLCNVELKGAGTGVPVAALTTAQPQRNWLISAFDHDELHAYRQAGGRGAVGVLAERWHRSLLDTGETLSARSINLSWRTVTAARVKAIHEAGFEVMVYTVNRLPTARRLMRYGADALFTDRPDRISRAALAP
ncbi:MAG: glycerophosphodiester phosphodiesterase family protein [Pseudomonadota bacterium]